MNSKIAALVFLFNYDENCIKNIQSYIGSVDIVFAYDNSDIKHKNLEKKLKAMRKVFYINGCGNHGIAHAINMVAEKAVDMDYKWLITFDQDSFVPDDMIGQMRKFINDYPEIDKIGLIGPAIRNDLVKFKSVKPKITFTDWIIQSGALHNLNALKKVNGYDEKLFIDQVDIEYCVRLRENNFKIIILNHAILYHNTLDNNVKLLYQKGRKIFLNKYKPVRYYYVIRNNLYCAKKYKKTNAIYYAQLKRNLIVQLQTFLLEKNKLPRLKAIIYGYIDYKTGRMGKSKRKY